MQLNNECEELLSDLDDRPKFGTEFIYASFLYNQGLSRKETLDLIDKKKRPHPNPLQMVRE